MSLTWYATTWSVHLQPHIIVMDETLLNGSSREGTYVMQSVTYC